MFRQEVGSLYSNLGQDICEQKRKVGSIDSSREAIKSVLWDLGWEIASVGGIEGEAFDRSYRAGEEELGLGVRFLAPAADSSHFNNQHKYSPCHCEGSFVVNDYSFCWRCAELTGLSANGTGQFRCGRCLFYSFGAAKERIRDMFVASSVTDAACRTVKVL
jgi:hypothetical protein